MKHTLFLLTLFAAIITSAQQPCIDSLMKHVRFFASPGLKGRLPGDPGFDKAADYSMNSFRRYGIQNWTPSPDAYKQYFKIDANHILAAQVVLQFNKENISLKAGSDFSVRGYSGSGHVDAEIIFCGYGDEETGYSDYENTDVKGKIVMIFKANAPYLNKTTPFSIREKVDIAYRHGAKAVILVTQPNQKNPQKPIGSTMHGSGPMHTDVPQIQISVEMADKILAASGKKLSFWQSQTDSLKKSPALNTGCIAHLDVKADYKTEALTYNVIGLLPGTDSILKNEYIIISAHLDHVGYIGNEIIYPGANDNASGSSAVIEIARLFSISPAEKRKRSIVFVLFSCEEKGLVGSEFLAANLPVPTDKIVAMMNMDCIGYGDSIQVGNGLTCPTLWEKAKKISLSESLPMVSRTWKGGGADLTPFSAKQIPGLYFVTTNSYKFLHLPEDTPETLNQELYLKVVKLAFRLALETAGDIEYKREKTE